jgi:hypothetical protein
MRVLRMTLKPTLEQLTALQTYALEHGRTWKSQLNDDWMNGRASGPLQQVRNQFGPSWLIRFRLPKEKA